MTLDELTQLTEALTGDVTLAGLRSGVDLGVPDDAFVLLVRFISGERVEAPAPPVAPVTGFSSARSERREREPVSPEEAERRLAALDELEAPAKATDLGDGVILGFDFDD